MSNNTNTTLVKSKIHILRGKSVILDRDLAELYHVETRRLNEQVRRNKERFPADFMFQLTKDEFKNWKSQNAISNTDKMGLRHLPLAFTEQGVAMASGILKSKIAIEVNIHIMRAFIELRNNIALNPDFEILRLSIKNIESRIDTMDANNIVATISMEKKIMTMSGEIKKVSDTLDQLQDAQIIIKRPDEGNNNFNLS
ncbi:MAG: ORF6N domain-containing protein [bacterium]|nr:ORF6N domain-containing protein [bacterium]